MSKLFELESYKDRKTKVISRRFVDLAAYNRQKEFFKSKNPTVGASHIFKEGKWYEWNGKDYIEVHDNFVIVNSLEELIN